MITAITTSSRGTKWNPVIRNTQVRVPGTTWIRADNEEPQSPRGVPSSCSEYLSTPLFSRKYSGKTQQFRRGAAARRETADFPLPRPAVGTAGTTLPDRKASAPREPSCPPSLRRAYSGYPPRAPPPRAVQRCPIALALSGAPCGRTERRPPRQRRSPSPTRRPSHPLPIALPAPPPPPHPRPLRPADKSPPGRAVLPHSPRGSSAKQRELAASPQHPRPLHARYRSRQHGGVLPSRALPAATAQPPRLLPPLFLPPSPPCRGAAGGGSSRSRGEERGPRDSRWLRHHAATKRRGEGLVVATVAPGRSCCPALGGRRCRGERGAGPAPRGC